MAKKWGGGGGGGRAPPSPPSYGEGPVNILIKLIANWNLKILQI